MSGPRQIVVVGAGLAGAFAVETLRDEGFDGNVVFVGEEPVRPYERPPLSKDMLQGTKSARDVFVHDERWYHAHDVDLRTGTRARALDVDGRTVELDDGSKLGYDRLLLATGSAARPLRVPGGDLPGVHLLRTLADAQELEVALQSASHVVVVGAGWIGTEVAASARMLGRDVTLVGRGTHPLERIIGPELGAFYGDLHREHGVRLVMDTDVESLRGRHQVEEIRTTDGQVLPADLVVAGVGASPRVDLAEAAGLSMNDGISTDQCLHTSGNWVYAAGDVAAAWHPIFRRRVRVEHWANARHQGRLAARNMLGARLSHERVPYFYSDQFDVGMEYSGYAPEWDDIVLRGNPADREFVAFWLHRRRIVAGMSINVWDLAEPIQELVRSGCVVDPVKLGDPRFPLEDPGQIAA
jgi:3-phenylpropionate/trans-cinnamate dioxygenase ferredoxin reductase component